LREVVEKLKNKVIELRQIIKEKDLEYDEIKKETMDLLFIKETAYKALAEENAAALKKIESFTFEMDLAEKKQQKDMFKLKKFFERKLGEKDVFIHQLKDEIEENKQWVRSRLG
jgi:hypothetical protein